MRFILVLLIAASSCAAANFYVSKTGSDTFPGSNRFPWATLQHAVDSIEPGDTIIVEEGTYAGCRIGKPGTQHAPKTLKAAPNAQVLINEPGSENRHRSGVEVENFNLTMTDWTIEGFEIVNAPNYGIDVRVSDRITVKGNHVHNNGATGIFTAFSDHVLIDKNESDHNGEHGIYQSNSSKYPVIRGNQLHHNDASGIHLNGDISEGPPGIVQFATVESNVIWENGARGGSAINCDGVMDSIFRLNTLLNNHASGISLYAINAARGSSNNKIFNNTIVMAPHARSVINIPDWGVAPAPINNDVELNVLCTPDANNASILTSGAHVPGFVSDHNVVSNRFSTDAGDSIVTLSQWQTFGYDKHSQLGCDALLNLTLPPGR